MRFNIFYSKNSILLITLLTFIFSTSFKEVKKETSRKNVKVITITNKSDWEIDHIYISAVENDKWGEDLLGDDEILSKGESIRVEVDCGNWDVKIVAEDGQECVVDNINLCASDKWDADC